PECQEHITFTLKKLTTQASITRQDDTGNQQLYQIGNIFHRLGKPSIIGWFFFIFGW
ncbi:hypothetical protein MJI37_32950, partial [Salmonella enterica subsp. enterica serovar Cerro]|nr:hypothetical protein [Salmonella enterica subsp. enterica serovar Cerro]